MYVRAGTYIEGRVVNADDPGPNDDSIYGEPRAATTWGPYDDATAKLVHLREQYPGTTFRLERRQVVVSDPERMEA